MRCNFDLANTKNSRCQIYMSKIMRVVLTPDSETAKYDMSGNTVFNDWLNEKIHANSMSERFFPMPLFTNIESANTEATQYTDGYGNNYKMSSPVYSFKQSYAPDFCLEKRIQVLDSQTFRAFFIDDKNAVWGVEDGNYLKGFKVRIACSPSGWTTNSELSMPTVTYTLLASTEYEKLRTFLDGEEADVNVDYSNIMGLEQVTLRKVTDGSNTFVQLVSSCGGYETIITEFGTTLDTAACWTITGTGSVTYDAAHQGYKVASSITAINLANPAILYANDVTNIIGPTTALNLQ